MLAKPQTFMNRSGKAVVELLEDFGSDVSDLMVIYDDVEIPFGHIRIRERGTHAGHRGMQSVTEELQSFQIPRVRIGVGSGDAPSDLTDLVLEEFSLGERGKLPRILEATQEAVALCLEGHVGKAMSRFNRRDVTVDGEG